MPNALSTTLGYRRNVAALISDGQGRFLAGERSDIPGAWQIPQGGVELTESEDQALRRELREELGLNEVRIVARSPELIRYDFPPDVSGRDIVKRFRGQEQRYFLVHLPDPVLPDPAACDGEFRAFSWLTPDELVAAAAPFKRRALETALHHLKPYFPLANLS